VNRTAVNRTAVSNDVILYGLRIRSEAALQQGRPCEPGRALDLEIVQGPSMALTMDRPDGELIAGDELSETEWYSFVREPTGDYRLRYSLICDFLVSADLRRVTVCPVEGVDPDRVAVFTSGGLPAFILTMLGELVLHASAVEVGGRALAFVGPSGMGKSTLATLCCIEGARLVTDDVLRVDLAQGAPRVHLGAGELRLRPSSAGLADGFASSPRARHTADGRQALAPPAAVTELLPLAAIVIPLADRSAKAVSMQRLDPMQALLTLLAYPRLPGWADPLSHAEQMQKLGALVEQLDVYVGRIPWGPPFPAGLVETIFDAVGLSQSGC
jgi:hypothetical protein